MSAPLMGSMGCQWHDHRIMPGDRGKPWPPRRNRRRRTRIYGGVGAGADLLGQSPATRLAVSSVEHFGRYAKTILPANDPRNGMAVINTIGMTGG
jgi:hypothetical protein